MYGDSVNDITADVVKVINDNYNNDSKETSTSVEATEE